MILVTPLIKYGGILYKDPSREAVVNILNLPMEGRTVTRVLDLLVIVEGVYDEKAIWVSWYTEKTLTPGIKFMEIPDQNIFVGEKQPMNEDNLINELEIDGQILVPNRDIIEALNLFYKHFPGRYFKIVPHHTFGFWFWVDDADEKKSETYSIEERVIDQLRAFGSAFVLTYELPKVLPPVFQHFQNESFDISFRGNGFYIERKKKKERIGINLVRDISAAFNEAYAVMPEDYELKATSFDDAIVEVINHHPEPAVRKWITNQMNELKAQNDPHTFS